MSDNEKQVQAVVIELLQDNLADTKKVIRRMQATIILLIILLVGTFIYYEWSFKAFMSQYDYENVITTTNANNDNVTYKENSPINATIQNIKVNK